MPFRRTLLTNARTRTAGLSLIEMLISIALIAILAAVAIGFLSANRRTLEVARDRRNAQNLAVVCTVAHAVNLNFIVPNDPVESCRNTVRGGVSPSGLCAGKFFGVPGMAEAEIIGAAWYLDVRGSELIYVRDRPPPQ